MKRLFILVLGIALLLGIKFLFFPGAKDQTKSGPPPVQAMPVTIYVVDTAQLEQQITSTGTLRSNEEVDLIPEVSGKIVSLNFKEGDRVSKGQVLVKLNDNDLQAQLSKLQIQRKVQLEKADRLKSLLQLQGASQEEYDQAQNLVLVADADMNYVKAQIAKTEIRAPFSGIIGLRNLSEGAFVNANTPIARLQQTDLLKLDFAIPERYIDLLSLPLTVHFRVQGRTDDFKANVYALEPSVNTSTRTVQMRALVQNTNQQILSGQFAQVGLPLKTNHSALFIPTQAIIPILKGQKVFVCKNGKAQEAIVETGYRTDSQIEILSGLQAGDSVVVTGIMSLKKEAPLRVLPSKGQKKEAKG